MTSGGSEVIDNQTTFTQFDGTNTTNKLTIVSPDQHQPSRALRPSRRDADRRDDHGQQRGHFFFNGGAANVYDLQLSSGGYCRFRGRRPRSPRSPPCRTSTMRRGPEAKSFLPPAS